MVKMIFNDQPKWVHDFFVQPPAEGAIRLNLAFSECDFTSLARPPLSWKQRTVFLLTGIPLLFFPVVNAVIWCAWQVFGHPETYADPWIPQSAYLIPERIQATPKPPIVQPLIRGSRVENVEIKPQSTTHFSFTETKGAKEFASKWIVETFPNVIVASQETPHSTTHSRYSSDGFLQEFIYREPLKKIFIEARLDQGMIHCSGSRDGQPIKKQLMLDPQYPWMQQPTMGLKNFVLDPNRNEFHFSAVHPESFNQIILCTAKKLEVSPDQVKIELGLNQVGASWISMLHRAEVIYNAKTGDLMKMTVSGFIAEKHVIKRNVV